MNNGNSNNNNRNNSNRVRPVAVVANEPKTYDIPFDSIVEAFYDCIATKKSNNDCIVFMAQYQEQLHQLWEDVCYARYKPSTISVFIKTWPVMREILTRYVSLASIMCILLYPMVLKAFRPDEGIMFLCAILMAIFVVFMHRENIKRLYEGKESKLSFSKKAEVEAPVSDEKQKEQDDE